MPVLNTAQCTETNNHFYFKMPPHTLAISLKVEWYQFQNTGVDFRTLTKKWKSNTREKYYQNFPATTVQRK